MNKNELKNLFSRLFGVRKISDDVAAELLMFIHQNNDIENKTVADLNCGNGVFGVGSLLLGAGHVYFLDNDSMKIARENVLAVENEFGLEKNKHFFETDARKFDRKVDTAIMGKGKIDVLENVMAGAGTVYFEFEESRLNSLMKFAEKRGFRVKAVKRINNPKTVFFKIERFKR